MRTSLFTALSTTFALLAESSNAAPVKSYNSTVSSPFFLVTTSSSTSSSNSSALPSVSATSLFDPLQQSNYLLRLIGPGYFQLPNFTLTDGALHSLTTGPFGSGSFLYNSTPPVAGTELQFSQSVQGDGGLSLLDGYLLAVNGSGEGWTLCSAALGQTTLQYKGTGASCNATYVQAVNTAPY